MVGEVLRSSGGNVEVNPGAEVTTGVESGIRVTTGVESGENHTPQPSIIAHNSPFVKHNLENLEAENNTPELPQEQQAAIGQVAEKAAELSEPAEVPAASSQETPTAPDQIPHQETPLGLAETEKRATSFIKRHGQLLNLFSRDSSLKFVPSPTADTFSFDAKNFHVNVPLSWFANDAYTEGELEFANYHERAHFIDMRKNPEAYLDNFRQLEKDAGALAKDYCKTHPSQPATPVKQFYYQELHTLYNCLDDIYVNRLVAGRVPRFASGDGQAEVDTLYHKAGFGEADLTDQPLHKQFAFSLLRDAMLGESHGVSQVDDRVKSVLDKKVMGKSLRTLVDFDLSPRQGILQDPAERYKKIRLLIQPEYLKLLDAAMKDQEKQNQENQRNGQQGEGGGLGNASGNQGSGQNGAQGESGNQSDGQGNQQSASGNQANPGQPGAQSPAPQPESPAPSSFDPFRQTSPSGPPDFFDSGDQKDQVIRQILDSFAEDDQVKAMSPTERAQYQAKKRQAEFDEAHGISQHERATAEEVKAKIRPARRKMRTFWKNLIGQSLEYRQIRQRQQRKGRLNVRDYIRQYPEAVEAERKGDLRSLEVYDRNGLERVLTDQPEKIDVTLLVDCSGSMSSSRVQAARETAALLMYSLKDFNDEIESTREKTHTKLRADTQVIAFGSDFAEVKPFEKNHAKADADIIKSISAINSDLGSTNDAEPLRWLKANLTEQEKSAIQQKKLKKIIFEITDGQPDDPADTRASLRSLAQDGIIMVGFQIGDADEQEQATFRAVWHNRSGGAVDGSDVSSSAGTTQNNSASNLKGINIGSNVNTLPDRLMTELSEALSNIII